ncbi:MAG TPA: M24 family metallopeptidase [Candidatus Binatia bacterium]|nr:M24 family metallopeptidase [Candidatus Binatia bacterium]
MPWTTPPGSGATVYIWNGYSLAERDRRWSAVRANAAKAGFDCILVPLGDGIDARYMTQLRCSAMVLPTDGRAPIVVADRRSNNQWVPEPWQTGREWAEPMGEALRDLGFDRARIGVAGLKGGRVTHCDSIDGVVNHTALETAIGKVPNARFEDATDVIGLVRYVKSAEEMQFVRRSAEVAAAALDELIKLARPGIDAGIFYADVLAEMLALRSEYFPMTLTIDAIGTAKPKRYTNPPIGRRLEAGALITNEINATMGAQLTQVCQPVLLGKIPEPWKPVIALQREVYEAGLQMIKPGVTFGALEDFVKGFGAKSGMETMLQMHGCGYGGDGPLFTHRVKNDHVRDLTIEKNNTFVWKPMARSADGQIQFTFGGPVIVTDSGCESLFKREPGLVTTG